MWRYLPEKIKEYKIYPDENKAIRYKIICIRISFDEHKDEYKYKYKYTNMNMNIKFN